jgi:hypothetical protein
VSAEVDLLREKAAQMRKLAEAANTVEARTPYGDSRIPAVPESEWGRLVHNYLGGEVGDHCAAWTPAAATAVADLIEKAADDYKTKLDMPECAGCDEEECPDEVGAEFHVGCNQWLADCQCLAPFLKVAREFLRRDGEVAG